MANGTGLPIPRRRDVFAQSPQIVDVERGAGAAWASIASSFNKIENTAAGIAEREIAETRAAHFAQLENADDRQYGELATRYKDDPTGFDNAWKAYQDGALSETDPAAVKHRQRYLGKLGTRGYVSALANKRSEDEKNNNKALATAAENAEAEFQGFAMAGQANSPGAIDAMTKLRGVLETRRGAGFMTQEEVDQRLDRVAGRAAMETVKLAAGKSYEEHGDRDRAIEDLRKGTLENTSLRATPEEKQHFFNQGMREIHLRDAVRKQDKQEIILRSQELRERLKSGDIEDREYEEVSNALQKVGATREQMLLARERGSRRALGVLNDGRSLAEQSRLVGAASALNAAPPQIREVISEAARVTGVPVGYLAQTARRESSFRPGAQADTSSAGGLFQFIDDTWARVLREHGPKHGLGPGTSRFDARASTLMAAEMAKADKEALERSLGRPVSWGDAYVAHFAGREGAMKLFHANPNAAAASVLPAAAKSNREIFYSETDYGVVPKTVGQVLRQLKSQHESGGAQFAGVSPDDVDTVRSGLRVARAEVLKEARRAFEAYRPTMEKGVIPDLGDFAAIVQAARDSGDDKFIREVEAAGTAFDVAAQLRGRPEGEVLSRIEELRSTYASDGGLDLSEQSILGFLEKSTKEDARLLADDRFSFAEKLTGGAERALPLDISSREAFQAGLQERLRIDGLVQQAKGVPPGSVLRPTDVPTILGGLRSPDPKVNTTVIEGLMTLPSAVRDATISREMIGAIQGMSRSADPAKMALAYAFLGNEQKRDPMGFAERYGAETEKNLVVWNERLQFMTSEDLTKYQRERNDPDFRLRQQPLIQEADKLLKNIKASDVVAMFDKYPILPFTDPAAPVSVRPTEAPGLLLSQYQNRFRDFYAELGDKDAAEKAAFESVSKNWGVSTVGGGQLMQHPPERQKAYPAINGSHEWLVKQLDSDIKTALNITDPSPARANVAAGAGELEGAGAAMADMFATPQTAAQTANERRFAAQRALVADRTTEEDIAAGRPPSYQIIAQGPDGRYHRLEREPGRPMRFRGDHEAAQLEAEAAMTAQRAKDAAERQTMQSTAGRTLRALSTPKAGERGDSPVPEFRPNQLDFEGAF
jgi:hypothetical protein